MKPNYFKQQSKYTCSLAILRSVLSANKIKATEANLVKKIIPSYGKDFTNIWNPTIVKIAREYKIPTQIYAKWPLFKKGIIDKALKNYKKDSKRFNFKLYENSKDDDKIPEPLPLAYKDMFLAYKNGCKVTYRGLTKKRIKRFLSNNKLIQTSIKLHILYPGKKHAFHSILIYDSYDRNVIFHDPTHGKGLSVPFKRMLKATTDVGAFMVYNTK